MKLVNLLAQKMAHIDPAIKMIVQDPDGVCWLSLRGETCWDAEAGGWHSDYVESINLDKVAEDHESAIVTRGEWLKARQKFLDELPSRLSAKELYDDWKKGAGVVTTFDVFQAGVKAGIGLVKSSSLGSQGEV